MLDETFDTSLFGTALFGSERFPVVGDHQAGSSLLGLDIESGGGSLRSGLGAAKQKVGAVVIGRPNFVLHGFAHQFRWITIRRNGRWLPGKTGSSEQQNPGARVGDEVRDGIARDRGVACYDWTAYDWTEHVNPVSTMVANRRLPRG